VRDLAKLLALLGAAGGTALAQPGEERLFPVSAEAAYYAIFGFIILAAVFLFYQLAGIFGFEIADTLKHPPKLRLVQSVRSWTVDTACSVGFLVIMVMYYVAQIWRREEKGMAGLLPRRLTSGCLLRGLREDVSFFDAHPREVAARTLGRIGGRGAVGGLCRSLTADLAAGVRRAAAESLGRLGDPAAVEALTAALAADTVDSVRRTCTASLASIGDPRAIPALADALGREDAEGRRAVVEALGALAVGLPGGDPRRAEVVTLLEDAREDGRARVRRAAVEVLEGL